MQLWMDGGAVNAVAGEIIRKRIEKDGRRRKAGEEVHNRGIYGIIVSLNELGGSKGRQTVCGGRIWNTGR